MAGKKTLLGCLLVSLLLVVVGLGAAYWFVLRPMWSAGSDLVQGARDWASAVDIDDDVPSDPGFLAPADGHLSPAQVRGLVTVQQVVVREMGPGLEAVARRAREAQRSGNGPDRSLAEVATAYRELAVLVSELRAAQSLGIKEAGLSREEYAWSRRQALAALPLLVSPAQADALGSLPGVGITDEASMAAARHNAELLRPHLPILEKTLGAIPPMP